MDVPQGHTYKGGGTRGTPYSMRVCGALNFRMRGTRERAPQTLTGRVFP
jgi:hypothetical protein